MHNKKINPHTRRRGFTPRLPGRTTSAASPAIPASPTNPAIRFPFEPSNGELQKARRLRSGGRDFGLNRGRSVQRYRIRRYSAGR